ncbi:uncharacterized protein LAESUDRAFT_729892 [Laetiporus sulphureus 93-53]|uniref:rRNA biogenesis protein RRP36 n=1 Tax=Laetiporus sulphureus 93-53 TaxID=1314785 RepID=A0A165CE71_9APHY|nr:uncharacterized protein LAESUDRAFT_729892 [Laetiporus sulphureus 93-53]KZT02652.1 hypothetical protein LAESUDRAFT_729892 [Laetiporus sulphureus 93-53]
MPRRPRPAHRRPPKRAILHEETSKLKQDLTRGASRRHDPTSPHERDEESEAESSTFEQSAEGVEAVAGPALDGSDDDDEGHEEQLLEDIDIDAARVAQWVDEEELDEMDGDESESEPSSAEEEGADLENDLASLPFGALRNAQKALARARAMSESDEEEEIADSEPELIASGSDVKGKGREVDAPPKPKPEIPKRNNKHAPTEVSSKKPVPRKKLGVEGEKVVPRDPRFLPLTGEFSAKRFQSQYGFLAGMHTEEMKALKGNLKRARELLFSSPRNLREEREKEVQRLERAFKRAESMVNKDRRGKVEEEALDRAAKEEKEKRKAGKGAWHMKNSNKKELLMRAKYEALAASGGRSAVRKAIEKKQKKETQKEKKRRPFAPGPAQGVERKRSNTGSGDGGPRNSKRRREE